MDNKGLFDGIDKMIGLSDKAAAQLLDSEFIIACKDRTIWRQRLRIANAMVMFFELAAQCRGAQLSYYAASGLGPVMARGTQDYGDGCVVEYKRTPREWIPIWENVAEKARAKVCEANVQLKTLQGIGR